MNQEAQTGPIFWAVDPITSDPALMNKAAELIASFVHASGAEWTVRPVTVINPEQLNWPPEMHGDWEVRFREEIARRIEEVVADPNHRITRYGVTVLEPLILSQTQDSVQRTVEVFLEAAEKDHARLIVAATQSRHDLDRLILGSFCETLLNASPIPVLTVNPRTEIPASIDSLYFTTDLSDESHQQLSTAVQLARSLHSELVLVHKLAVPTPPIIEPGFVAAADAESIQILFAESREEQKNTLKSWTDEVSLQGIPCRAELIEEGGGLTEALLGTAHNARNAILAMAIQNQSGLSRLLGQVSRHLARESERPTLTLPVSGL